MSERGLFWEGGDERVRRGVCWVMRCVSLFTGA